VDIFSIQISNINTNNTVLNSYYSWISAQGPQGHCISCF